MRPSEIPGFTLRSGRTKWSATFARGKTLHFENFDLVFKCDKGAWDGPTETISNNAIWGVLQERSIPFRHCSGKPRVDSHGEPPCEHSKISRHVKPGAP